MKQDFRCGTSWLPWSSSRAWAGAGSVTLLRAVAWQAARGEGNRWASGETLLGSSGPEAVIACAQRQYRRHLSSRRCLVDRSPTTRAVPRNRLSDFGQAYWRQAQSAWLDQITGGRSGANDRFGLACSVRTARAVPCSVDEVRANFWDASNCLPPGTPIVPGDDYSDGA